MYYLFNITEFRYKGSYLNGLEVLGENIHFDISGYFVISEFDIEGVDCSVVRIYSIMGEKLSLLEIDIPIRSIKCRIVEEETIGNVSAINKGSVHICEDVNQEASEISIHTIGEYQLIKIII